MTLEEFADRLENDHGVNWGGDILVHGSNGHSHRVRQLERSISDGRKAVGHIVGLQDDDDIAPSLARNILRQLGIPESEFGYDLDED